MADPTSTPAYFPGFTAEQAASLQAMVTASVTEAFNRGKVYELKSGLLITRPQTPAPTNPDQIRPRHDQQATTSLQRENLRDHQVGVLEPNVLGPTKRAQYETSERATTAVEPQAEEKRLDPEHVEQQPLLMPKSTGTSAAVEANQAVNASTATKKRKPNVIDNSTPSIAKRSRPQLSSTGSLKNDRTSHAANQGEAVNIEIPKHLEYSYACPKLPVTQPLGYPHLINLERFSRDTIMENIKMADIVGTILFNYAPDCLDAFLDVEGYSVVLFSRHDRIPNLPERTDADPFFVIRRQGGKVTIGDFMIGFGPVETTSETFEYMMPTQGAWQPVWHDINKLGKTYTVEGVESKAKEFASRVLLDKKWDGVGYKIVVDVKKSEKPTCREIQSPVAKDKPRTA